MKHHNPAHQICANNFLATGPELMLDAKLSSAALRLPLYWFSDPTMRAKYRIPHYLIGGLVRYRMSELQAWAVNSQAIKKPALCDEGNAKTNGGESEAGLPHA